MLPKSMKTRGRPLMVELSLITCEPPRAIDIMPSVTMKDGTLQRSEMKPLMKPQSAPTRSTKTMASGIESSGSSSNGTQRARKSGTMMVAPTTVASAITEPTERSMPPTRMTKVMPTASTVFMATWPNMRVKLSPVAKYGAKTMNRMTSTTRARPTPASRSEKAMARLASDNWPSPLGVAGVGAALMRSPPSMLPRPARRRGPGRGSSCRPVPVPLVR